MKSTILIAAALGVASAAVPAPARAETAPTVASALQARQAERWPRLGAMVDVGVPDGLIGSLVVRPWKWVRVYGGGGSNSVSKGWRAGLALIPFGSGPSLAIEYGGYGQGDANGLVRSMTGGEFDSSPLLSKLAYDYANAHAGLEFGGKYFTFFVHGGVSMVWAQLHSAGGTLANTGTDTVVQVTQDPKLKAFGSSLKVGLILFML
ncbi:MAG: hypothetical protein JXP73_02695 [Deltaproteobacteria bacterium]|nr:hypothetical protein [Deltaproteobacteria bacterium]